MKQFLAIVFTVLSWVYFGQFKDSLIKIDVNLGFGNLAPHKDDVKHLQESLSTNIELGISKRTQGERYFHIGYKYPYYGIALNYLNSGNPSVIGSTFALYTYGSLPVSRKLFPFRFRFGAGLGCITQPFKKYGNHTNNAIGSHLNVNIQLRFEKTFKISTHHELYTAIGVTHFSNAAVQRPNLGLNYLHLYIGTSISQKELDTVYFKKPDAILALLRYEPKRFSINIGGSIKSGELPLSQKFPVFGMSVRYERQFQERRAWLLSSDWFLNYELNSRTDQLVQSGISLTYLQCFDQLRIGLGMGGYVLNHIDEINLLYHNVIIEYWFNHRFYAQVMLKSHWAAADFFLTKIGYRIF